MNILNELNKYYHDVFINGKDITHKDIAIHIYYNPYFILHFNRKIRHKTNYFKIRIIRVFMEVITYEIYRCCENKYISFTMPCYNRNKKDKVNKMLLNRLIIKENRNNNHE